MRSAQNKTNQKLGTGLQSRQVTMISIGGVIGAGLFVGSSNAIAAAGPAVLVSYLIAAVIVVLVMQMLGEMATARPDTGSFSSYADQAIGRWHADSLDAFSYFSPRRASLSRGLLALLGHFSMTALQSD